MPRVHGICDLCGAAYHRGCADPTCQRNRRRRRRLFEDLSLQRAAVHGNPRTAASANTAPASSSTARGSADPGFVFSGKNRGAPPPRPSLGAEPRRHRGPPAKQAPAPPPPPRPSLVPFVPPPRAAPEASSPDGAVGAEPRAKAARTGVIEYGRMLYTPSGHAVVVPFWRPPQASAAASADTEAAGVAQMFV